MSSLHFFTIFCRNSTEEAEAVVKSVHAERLKPQGTTVDEKIIMGHFLPGPNGSSSVVTQMKDSSLNPEPTWNQPKFLQPGPNHDTDHRRYRAKATEMCLPNKVSRQIPGFDSARLTFYPWQATQR